MRSFAPRPSASRTARSYAYHSVILGDLLSSRWYAGDLRSYTMQDLLLAQYRRVAGIYRDAQLALARKNVVTRLAGSDPSLLPAIGSAV